MLGDPVSRGGEDFASSWNKLKGIFHSGGAGPAGKQGPVSASTPRAGPLQGRGRPAGEQSCALGGAAAGPRPSPHPAWSLTPAGPVARMTPGFQRTPLFLKVPPPILEEVTLRQGPEAGGPAGTPLTWLGWQCDWRREDRCVWGTAWGGAGDSGRGLTTAPLPGEEAASELTSLTVC